MATVLDKEQTEAQNIFRISNDLKQMESSITSILEPISSSKPFDLIYLNNLRLWQFQTLCKMELEHHNKISTAYELDVTSLILVFSSPLQFVLEWMKTF
jgi:hypothetical protein